MRAVSTAASVVRHAGGAVAEALLVAALIAALLLALSPVYKPADFLAGGERAQAAQKGTYSITLVGPAGAARAAVTYGSTVTTFSTYGRADPAYARVRCTANSSTVTSMAVGAQVYDVFKSIREGAWNTDGYASFPTDMSPVWTAGGADCTASLLTYTMHNADRVWKTLASVGFNVVP